MNCSLLTYLRVYSYFYNLYLFRRFLYAQSLAQCIHSSTGCSFSLPLCHLACVQCCFVYFWAMCCPYSPFPSSLPLDWPLAVGFQLDAAINTHLVHIRLRLRHRHHHRLQLHFVCLCVCFDSSSGTGKINCYAESFVCFA